MCMAPRNSIASSLFVLHAVRGCRRFSLSAKRAPTTTAPGNTITIAAGASPGHGMNIPQAQPESPGLTPS